MTHRLLFLCAAAGACAACATAPTAVRNPFWPIDHTGVSTPISAEIRISPKPQKPAPKAEPVLTGKKAAAEAAIEAARAAAEAVKPPREVTREDWLKARRALRLTSPAVYQAEDGTRRTTININGNIYADNDFISVTHDDIRFTWRIKGLDSSAESLKLVRVKARCLNENEKGARK